MTPQALDAVLLALFGFALVVAVTVYMFLEAKHSERARSLGLSLIAAVAMAGGLGAGLRAGHSWLGVMGNGALWLGVAFIAFLGIPAYRNLNRSVLGRRRLDPPQRPPEAVSQPTDFEGV